MDDGCVRPSIMVLETMEDNTNRDRKSDGMVCDKKVMVDLSSSDRIQQQASQFQNYGREEDEKQKHFS